MKKLSLPLLLAASCNFLNPDIPEDTCGDLVVDASLGEECDDGNLIETDGCHNDCTLSGCGDGVVDPGEICFDAGSPINIGAANLTANFLGAEIPGTMRLGDLNNDGNLDYVISAPGSDFLVVGLGNGNGLFQNAIQVPVGQPLALSLADFNSDDILDVVVSRPLAANGGDVVVLDGVGDGTFDNARALIGGNLPLAVIAGDLDQDGLGDVAVLSTLTTFLLDETDFLSVFEADAEGNFTLQNTNVPLANDLNSTDITIADMDESGTLDLITADSAGRTVSIIPQSNFGTFSVPTLVEQVNEAGTFGVSVGDINNDSLPDIAAANFNSRSLSVNINQGDGTFVNATIFVDLSGPQRVALVDIDQDGNLDMIATVNNPDAAFKDDVLIFLGDGTDFGFDSEPTKLSAGTGSFDLFVGDLNGDEADDIIVHNTLSDDVSVILANP